MALADQVIDYTRALPRPGHTGQLRSLQATRPGANSVSRQYAKTTEAIDHSTEIMSPIAVVLTGGPDNNCLIFTTSGSVQELPRFVRQLSGEMKTC